MGLGSIRRTALVLGAAGFAGYIIRRGHERTVFDLLLLALALSGVVLPYGLENGGATAFRRLLSCRRVAAGRRCRPCWVLGGLPACRRAGQGLVGRHGIKRFKGIWWMPWHQEAMKDVVGCDKPRGAASRL